MPTQSQELIAEGCRRLARNLTAGQWRQIIGDLAYQGTCLDLPLPDK